MEIVDNTCNKAARTTTLNGIPVGQVFRGTVIGSTGARWNGLFRKIWGPTTQLIRESTRQSAEVIVEWLEGNVVNKDGKWSRETFLSHGDGRNPIFVVCRPVENYEPLTATLTLTRGE